MSSDTTADTDERTATTETRDRIEALEVHLSPEHPPVTERLSTVRARVTEYEQAESEADEQGALDKIEAELEAVRTSIESELDKGKAEAKDLLDDIETTVSNLRK